MSKCLVKLLLRFTSGKTLSKKVNNSNEQVPFNGSDNHVVCSCGHNRGGCCQEFVVRREICVNCVSDRDYHRAGLTRHIDITDTAYGFDGGGFIRIGFDFFTHAGDAAIDGTIKGIGIGFMGEFQ